MADERTGVLGFLRSREPARDAWRHELIDGGGGITKGDVVDQLEKAPGLENAPTSSLIAMLRGARRVEPGTEPLFAWRERPREAFYVVMAGRIELRRPGSPPWTQKAKFTVGSHELIAGAEMDAEVRVVAGAPLRAPPLPSLPSWAPGAPAPDATPKGAPELRAGAAPVVVRISGDTFRDVLATDIELQIAVQRNTTTQPGPALTPARRASNVYLLTAGSQHVAALLGLPPSEREGQVISRLTDLVAETIVEHMFDSVLLIHVRPAGALRPPDRTERYVWAREGDALEPIVAREAALLPGVRADALPGLLRGAPLGDGKLGGARARVPLGKDWLSILPVRGHVGTPRAAVLERRVRALPPAGLERLIADELGPDGGDDARVVLVEVGPETAALQRCPYNVVYLIGAPRTAIEIQPQGDGHALIPSAVLPIDRKVPVTGDAPWPTGTVRLRFGPTLGARLHDPARPEPSSLLSLDLPPGELEATRATLQRWARAIVGRRVGVALGGGGPYGFVHAPLIQQLCRVGVPIDLVSGSSMGAVVGAYFSAFGEVDKFEDHRYELLKRFFRVSFFGSGTDFQEVFDQDLGGRTLLDLEVPFFPVVTDARSGAEWSIRTGSLGLGTRASGSLPPFFPTTFIGDRRFLDGGVVANVPSRVLRDEGSALIIASNPVSDVKRSARSEPLFRWQDNGAFFLLRLLDTGHLIPLLFGALGDNQSRDAHVVFRPTEAGTPPRLLGLRPIDVAGIVAADNAMVPERLRRWIHDAGRVDGDAASSLNLNRAVNQAKDAWRHLLRNPPSRAWLDVRQRTVEIEDGYAIVFKEGSEQLDPSCTELLAEVADLLQQAEVGGITLRVTAGSVDLALRRAEHLRTRLAGLDVDVDDDRVKLDFAVGDDAVKLVNLVLRTDDDVARLRQQLAGLTRAANAGKLRDAASHASVEGDPDLARLLAIEASALDRSVETDAVLRSALLLRSRLTRAIEGLPSGDAVPAVDCLAWHPGPTSGLLAVGDAHGHVRVVSAASGAGVTAPRLHWHRVRDHAAAVLAVAWSSDGSLLASVGDDSRILVHAVAADAAATPALRCEADTGTWLSCGVSFSPAGDRLLATCPPPAGAARKVAGSCVGIWTVSSSALTVLHVLQHDAIARCAAWDRDGELVAVGDEAGAVTVWSAADGALRSRYHEGGRFAGRLAWFTEGAAADAGRRRRLAVARETETTIYDVDGGGAPVRLVGHTAALSMVAWSPGGDLLITTAADHTARIWEARSGALRMVVYWSATPLVGAAWHPASGPSHLAGGNLVRLFVTWSECGRAQMWDATSGQLFAVLSGQRAAIHDAAFSPLGDSLATGSEDGSVAIWSPVEPVPTLGPLGAPVAAPIATVAWGRAEDDEVIATAFDGSVIAWRPRDGRGAGAALLGAPPARPEGATIGSPIASAAVSPDRRVVAVTRRPDRSPYLVDLRAPGAATRLGPAPAEELPEHPAWDIRYPLSWSADQRCLAVHYGRSAAVWDVVTGERLLVLVGPTEEPTDIDDDCFRWIAWHPTDGRRFAVARWFHGHSVELWTLGAKEPLRCGDETTGHPWQVAWSPDGAQVAAAHHDGRARIYDAATGAVLHTLVHEHGVATLAWRPDGSALATGDLGGVASVWERRAPGPTQGETYELASERAAQPDDVRVVLWSPDGQRMLSCGDGASAWLWRAEDAGGVVTWRVVAKLRGHRASIGAAAFDPTGEHVATGSDDGTVRLEPATFEGLVAAVGSHLGRPSLDESEWKRHMGWAGERRPTWPRR
jgi:WD40 repeat protein/predicted acylesterase/phospholipase RssA